MSDSDLKIKHFMICKIDPFSILSQISKANHSQRKSSYYENNIFLITWNLMIWIKTLTWKHLLQWIKSAVRSDFQA